MRIGIVSEEFSIYPPFGGIATANEGLVSGLALAGHDVELIYFPERPLEQRLLEQERKLRARVIELPEAHQHRQRPSARSYTAYRRLRDADYDVLCWPDYRGPGFYSMLAKRNGIAFQNCQQVILSYGPLAWCRECSANLHFRPEHAEIDHLERQAYRMADHVVFNSAYLSGWCQDKQYQIQHQTVIPSLVGAHFRSDGQLKTAEDFPHVGQTRPIKELAFFGRLETRKGFEVFIDALTRLQKQIDVSGMRVYFFGRPIKNQGLHSHIQIINKLADSPYRIFLVDDASTDEFLQFCKGREILAVMPSINDNLPGTVIECVNNQIPLVASNLGGIPEIIDPQHHGVLCEVQPETLCQRLLQALQHGHPIARPAYWPQQILDRWSDFLQQLAPDPTNADPTNTDAANAVPTTATSAATPAAPPAATSEPCAELTVGLVHYNRPQLLKRSLMSILQQTLKPAKVIVVDDNSPDQQTLRSVVEPFRYLASDLGIDLELSVNSENIYLGACRNRILATATSKYILFLDDDDVAMPEMLAELYACAVRDDADVVVQQHYYLPEQDQQVTPYEEVINRRQPPVWFFRGDDTESGLFLNIFGPASCLFATEALRSLGGYTEQKGVGFEDYELIFKLALMDRRFSVHSEPLYAYRTNPNSMVQTTSEQANYGRVFRMLKEFLPQAKRPINVDVLLESLFSHHHSAAAKPASIKLHYSIEKLKPGATIKQIARDLRSTIKNGASNIHIGKSSLRLTDLGPLSDISMDDLHLLSLIDWQTSVPDQRIESLSPPLRALVQIQEHVSRGDWRKARDFYVQCRALFARPEEFAIDYALLKPVSLHELGSFSQGERRLMARIMQFICGSELSSKYANLAKLDVIKIDDQLGIAARWDGLEPSIVNRTQEFKVGPYDCVKFHENGLLVHPNSDKRFVYVDIMNPTLSNTQLAGVLFRFANMQAPPVEVHMGSTSQDASRMTHLCTLTPDPKEQLQLLSKPLSLRAGSIRLSTKMPLGCKPDGARISISGLVYRHPSQT